MDVLHFVDLLNTRKQKLLSLKKIIGLFYNLNIQIIFIFIFICINMVHIDASAQKILVKKSKGYLAIVESSEQLTQGFTYHLQPSSNSAAPTPDAQLTNQTKITPSQVNKKSILNSMALNADLMFKKSSQFQQNELNLELRYGWIFNPQLEIGTLLHLNLIDQGAGFNTYYLIGGYADWLLSRKSHFNDEQSASHFIWGSTGQLYTGHKIDANESDAQIIGIAGGGYLTYQFPGTYFTFRSEGLVVIEAVNTSSTSATLSGFKAQWFVQYYF